jgi:D-lactate dehydrogenase
LEGNLHLTFAQSFSEEKEIKRYQKVMERLSELIITKYGGSLKAEHGTGRNMAPFVEIEWGKEAYALMIKIKSLFDPNNILNPGVILNEDPLIYLKNLKVMLPKNVFYEEESS